MKDVARLDVINNLLQPLAVGLHKRDCIIEGVHLHGKEHFPDLKFKWY